MSLLAPPTIALLTALYTSPARHYHSLSHVHALLGLLATHRSAFADADAVEAAIWFHDAIYDPRAKPPANEDASAALAVQHLRDTGVDAARLERVRAMILATATHTVPAAEALSGGGAAAVRDAALFLDMDLSVLGAGDAAFDEYEQGVRREYNWVDDAGWRKGRGDVLRGFLARDTIYFSELFRELLEERARANLKRAVERLGE